MMQSQRMEQRQSLSLQMQHSLKLLQAPIQELQTLVREELESNPTLEEEADDAKPAPESAAERQSKEDREAKEEMNFEKEFEVLLKLDEEWRDYFSQEGGVRRMSAEDQERRQFFFDSIVQPESLADHLLEQLRAFGLSEAEETVAELIIGSLDERGFLQTPLEELAQSSGHTTEELQHVLGTVQELHPIGVGARDLRECLLLQLDRLGKGKDLEASIVRDHLKALADKRYDLIMTALQVTSEQVQQAAALIATLDPHPGSRISAEPDHYVVPDVVVEKNGTGYVVILNDEQIPHLRISDTYKQLMGEAKQTSEVKEYIRQKIQSGKFLIRSIHQRQQTIYNIATEIVHQQIEFLDSGVSHLKLLTMAQVANVVGLHETTVGRAISGKYMQTHRGLFEMKYFFTPGVQTADGKMISTTSIKEVVSELIKAENLDNPFSDQEIAAKLSERGIPLARRTVAKYRDELKILPAHLRKRS